MCIECTRKREDVVYDTNIICMPARAGRPQTVRVTRAAPVAHRGDDDGVILLCTYYDNIIYYYTFVLYAAPRGDARTVEKQIGQRVFLFSLKVHDVRANVARKYRQRVLINYYRLSRDLLIVHKKSFLQNRLYA